VVDKPDAPSQRGLWISGHAYVVVAPLENQGARSSPAAHRCWPCSVQGRTATHSRSRSDEIVVAVRVVARCEALFGAGIAARMLQHFDRATTSSPFPERTKREHEVLGLLAAGHRARDVGLGEPGRAELPPPTWCQEGGVPSSMIIDDECARCH
jgi:hypothetical protein